MITYHCPPVVCQNVDTELECAITGEVLQWHIGGASEHITFRSNSPLNEIKQLKHDGQLFTFKLINSSSDGLVSIISFTSKQDLDIQCIDMTDGTASRKCRMKAPGEHAIISMVNVIVTILSHMYRATWFSNKSQLHDYWL